MLVEGGTEPKMVWKAAVRCSLFAGQCSYNRCKDGCLEEFGDLSVLTNNRF